MNVTGMIICHEHYDFRGGVERRDYEWQGGELAYIGPRFINEAGINKAPIPGDIINIGPFQLKVIDQDWQSLSYIMTRNGWKAQLRYILYHTTKILDKIYHRLIITAAVWGLADYHEALIPTWRDIHLLKKLPERK